MHAFLGKEAEQRNERAATNRSGEGYAACDAERGKDLRGDLRVIASRLLRCPKKSSGFFDRCAKIRSLYPPPAALIGALLLAARNSKKNPQLALAVKTICNHYGYNDFEYLTFTMESSNELEIHANYLARWKIICLKREIERYEELVAQYGQEAASVIYKAEWIDLDPARAVQISELGSAPMVDLIDFLEEYVSSESKLQLNDPSFERFSRDFQDLFHRAFPDEKINTGKNRDYWKHEAINNHLKTLNERLNNGSYELKAVKIDGTSEKCFLLTFNPEH